MSKPKLCKLCHKNPAEVPDRDRYMGGRWRREVCRECHADRLRGDFARILEARTRASSNTQDEV